MIVTDELNNGTAFVEWASLFSGGLFMMLVVYADESGTHGTSNGREAIPIISGWISA